MPPVTQNSTAGHYPVFVLPVLPAGAVAVINPPVLTVEQGEHMTAQPMLTNQQIRSLGVSLPELVDVE